MAKHFKIHENDNLSLISETIIKKNKMIEIIIKYMFFYILIIFLINFNIFYQIQDIIFKKHEKIF